jgi:hypothetical protein
MEGALKINGEILSFKNGKPLHFNILQRRLQKIKI